MALIAGDYNGLFALIGSKSALAEAEEEIAAEWRHGLEQEKNNDRGGVSLVVLLFLLGSSIAVAAGMGLAGLILNQLYSPMPMSRIVGELTWSTTSNFILTAIPFYIMLARSCCAAARPSACMRPWCSGCRGCPAG